MLDQVNMVEISQQHFLKFDRLRVLVVPISVDFVKKYLPKSDTNDCQTISRKVNTQTSGNTSTEETFDSLKPKDHFSSLAIRSGDKSNTSIASPGLDSCVITTDVSKSLTKPSTETFLQLVPSNDESVPDYDEDDWLVHATGTCEYDRVFQNFVFNSVGKDSTEGINEIDSTSSNRLPDGGPNEIQDRGKSSQQSAKVAVSSHSNRQSKVLPGKEGNRDERIQSLKELLAQQEEAVNKLMKQPKVVLSDCLENNNCYFSRTTNPLKISSPIRELQKSDIKKQKPLKRCHRNSKVEKKETVKKRRAEQNDQQVQRRNVTSRRRQKKFSQYTPRPEYVEMRRKKDLWMSKDTVPKEDFLAALGLFPV